MIGFIAIFSTIILVYWVESSVKLDHRLLQLMIYLVRGIAFFLLVMVISPWQLYMNVIYNLLRIIKMSVKKYWTFLAVNICVGMLNLSAQSEKTDLWYGYSKTDSQVFHLGKIIEKADSSTFKNFTEDYYFDKNNLFYMGKIVEGADVNSLEKFDNIRGVKNFIKDSKYMYREGVIQKEIDAPSFVIIDDYYAKDKSHVYYQSKIIENIDPVSFRVINYYHAVDKQHLIMEGKIIPNIDAASFEVLNAIYSKDAHAVFYQEKPVLMADPKTARAISPEKISSSGIKDFYLKDKNRVYLYGEPVVGSDPNSFSYVQYGYGKDADFVYYQNSRVLGANPNNIQFLNFPDVRNAGSMFCLPSPRVPYPEALKSTIYMQDGKSIYLNGKPLAGADIESFEWLDAGYARDKNNIYYLNYKINDVDLESFKRLNYGYSLDKNNVYYVDKIADEADPTSFEVISGADWADYPAIAKDKNHVYVDGKISDKKLESIDRYRRDASIK